MLSLGSLSSLSPDWLVKLVEAGGRTNLTLISLVVVVMGVLAYVFFGKESTGVKTITWFMMFGGAVLLVTVLLTPSKNDEQKIEKSYGLPAIRSEPAAVTGQGPVTLPAVPSPQQVHAERVTELRKYDEIIRRGEALLIKTEGLDNKVREISPSAFTSDDIDRINDKLKELRLEEDNWTDELRKEETVISDVFDGEKPDPLPYNPPPEKVPIHEPADGWRLMSDITKWFKGLIASKVTTARAFSIRLASEVEH
jgi:hypothetical protein